MQFWAGRVPAAVVIVKVSEILWSDCEDSSYAFVGSICAESYLNFEDLKLTKVVPQKVKSVVCGSSGGDVMLRTVAIRRKASRQNQKSV